MKKKFIILGGGVTGSAMAYFLSQKGFKVDLYEKGISLGGLSRSVWIDEWECWNDIGPHIFHSPDKEITELWIELFSDMFQIGDYYSAVIKGNAFNKYYSYPLSVEGIKKDTKISLNNKVLSNISHKEQANANNFREMMQAKVGHEIEKMFFRDYPEKLWGIPTDQMRSEWAPKRISIRKEIKSFFDGQFVATSKKGAGHIYIKILKILRNNGVGVFLESEVKRIISSENKIKEIVINDRKINTENYYVISTLPVPVLSKFIGLNMSLKYRGVRVSNWITSTREILPSNYGWVYFDEKNIPFTRLTDYTKMSPKAIEPSKGIITAECPFSSDEIQSLDSKEHHLEKVRNSLLKIPWLENKLIDCCSFFQEPYVYPLREQGYENELNIFNSKVSKFDNLWSIGAGGGFEYSDSQILFRKAKDFSDDIESDFNKGTQRQLVDSSIKVKKLEVFNTPKTFIESNNKIIIISEIGINHNGSIEQAKKLIQESKKAGVDFVKFQLYNPEKRASVNIRDAFYSEIADGEGENLKELFESCHLSFEDLTYLKEFSDNCGIEMFVSAFDKESVYKASKLNSQIIKISSMDLTNIEVWDAATDLFKNIVSSTGMSSINEVKRSYNYAIGKNKKIDITLLHCVSSYPMPIDEACLGRMNQLKNITPNVGYSDHSTTVSIPYTAALMGAKIIEKHFTLNKGLNGPDHIHSLTPSEMKMMITLIKNIPEIISEPNHQISKIQKKEMMKQKKGYFYSKNLSKGNLLKKDDIKLGAPCRIEYFRM